MRCMCVEVLWESKNPDRCDILAKLHQKTQNDVGSIQQRQLHFVNSSAVASNMLIAVENHLLLPWQR